MAWSVLSFSNPQASADRFLEGGPYTAR
ncbi:unnamed protein product [Ectocarpus sp. CCAP 1310/34]|nr:unnamed protein product [Ectocarpus sp. CCAP 1310/34]